MTTFNMNYSKTIMSRSVDPIAIEECEMKTAACRGCMAAERSLVPLESVLADLYSQLIGGSVLELDILPKFLCCICRSLLIKFSAFKEKCLLVQSTFLSLHSARIPLTTDLLQSLAGHPYPNLRAAFIHTETYDPNSSDDIDGLIDEVTEIKKEEAVIDINDTSEYTGITQIDDFDDEDDMKPLKQIMIIANENYNSDENYNDNNDENIQDLNDNLDSPDLIKKCSKKVNSKPKTTRKGVKKKTVSPKMKTKLIDGKIQKLNLNVKTLKEGNAKKVFKTKPQSKHAKMNVYREMKRNEIEKKYNVKLVRLTKEEQIKQVLDRKNSMFYKLAIFKCNVCYRGFRMELAYKNHMTQHDLSRGDFLCDVCNMRFPHKCEWKRHLKDAHEFDLVCNECGFVTKGSVNAAIHYKKHIGVSYTCKECGKSFDKPNKLWDHMHVTHGGTTACAICDVKFLGTNGLRTHMYRMHKEAIGAVCDCGVQFHSAGALRRHRPQGNCDQTLRPCAVCGEGLPTEELLQQHRLECHKTEPGFKCTVCGKHFLDKIKYKSHTNNHILKHKASAEVAAGIPQEPPQQLMCEICGCNVKGNKAILDKHRRTHTGEKLFQCEICNKRFTSKHYLGVHTAKHLGIALPVKNYPCRFCNKQFNHSGNRTKHERAVHEKLRPFRCEICENTFQNKDSLQNHVNHTHEGIPWPKRDKKREREQTRPQVGYL